MLKLFILLIVLTQSVQASTYIEFKNELPLDNDFRTQKATNHLRLGHKFNNTYIEFGPMTNGKSIEAGYKFKRNKWTFKGKIESKDTGSFKSKVETEIRYTFND